ncbi:MULTISPECIES: hypothetical protein [Alkalihalophilus]|uniref:Uncharacterized protein n=1 Tax=Alkalihalophilus pseudofirmus (strain ATCC BAA-2126 / JCM 17055 / OF4) TaxID=398511 RepID=D3FSS3_ALKPO|nr:MULTISPECIES: hypothetical protein [Alkalihalophilus]ADC51788.1 hypothetical protein BpOF4_18745 [Alkalihalophilus pseudofirmus OF4]MEC2073596.1 hypothetical protein [Alkalihalophilus marmarensis]MED1603573.1 hypothetical protein [Alkalihalophilus marmarensis]WEG15391.1 hypothetical protein PQ478_12680 [Alkalihalophilus pseudofirmus]
MTQSEIKEMNAAQSESRRLKVHKELDEQFKKPLIHKAITSNTVYVPLNKEKLWG